MSVFLQVVDEDFLLTETEKDRGLEGRPADIHHFLTQVEGHQRSLALDMPDLYSPVSGGREEDPVVEVVVP